MTATGRMPAGIFAALAAYERELMHERAAAARGAARARGSAHRPPTPADDGPGPARQVRSAARWRRVDRGSRPRLRCLPSHHLPGARSRRVGGGNRRRAAPEAMTYSGCFGGPTRMSKRSRSGVAFAKASVSRAGSAGRRSRPTAGRARRADGTSPFVPDCLQIGQCESWPPDWLTAAALVRRPWRAALAVIGFPGLLAGQETVRVIFFMTMSEPDLTGRSAPAVLGNS